MGAKRPKSLVNLYMRSLYIFNILVTKGLYKVEMCPNNKFRGKTVKKNVA